MKLVPRREAGSRVWCICTGVCASGEEAVRCPQWYISDGPELGLHPSGCLCDPGQITLPLATPSPPWKSDQMPLFLKLNDSWDGAHDSKVPTTPAPKHLIPPLSHTELPFNSVNAPSCFLPRGLYTHCSLSNVLPPVNINSSAQVGSSLHVTPSERCPFPSKPQI